MTPDRDRDPEGRAKNARPRDALGRPLPRGETGDPAANVEPEGTAEELLAMGVEHFNAGRFFQAHECWETAWHPSPPAEREFWQGITQIAVGFTHHGRGNPTGAVTLLRRGAERCAGYGDWFLRLNVGELARAANTAATAIESEGAQAQVVHPRAELRA